MSTADYKTMTTAQIRTDFLSFFESKGCKLYPSSSLIPSDPSLLLANAGMNQFKEYYQGKKTMDAIGATSCQKCLRTNDIENIGDARHLSFFEMLGNFSFGGYSKADAIAWAYEFITSPEHLGLPKDRLYMTVFENDDEAIELWHEQGVAYDHISRLGEEDNFWAAGPTGPCGPCSEIYFDQGPEFEGEAPGDDGDRYLEFWNLVFTQYDRQEDGSMPDLPHRNIDTGMGLERIAAIMQHKGSNYEGDVMRSLIALGEKLSGVSYTASSTSATDKSLRILADHARAVTFMIGDGILPGNEGRGYVLRRLLRRGVYHGRLLGIAAPFMGTYAHEVEEILGDHYPELKENSELIQSIIAAEEERFSATLDAGEAMLTRELEALGAGALLSGEVAFKLHDTYGFPIDLTCEIAQNAGHKVDMDAFNTAMNEQRERARASAHRDAWGQANNVWVELSDKLAPSAFVGYADDHTQGCSVVALVQDGALVDEVSKGAHVEVVLERTPFYGEMGGQVGDTGTLTAAGVELCVHDTKMREGVFISHEAEVLEGTLHVGDTVDAVVDHGRRELIRRNHTATHLLDAALKKVLGSHVNQAGSLVAPDRLRFDFTHFEALTQEQIERIEGMVNAEIFAAEPMVTRVMGLEEAKASGAVALFGEKYSDVVRVVSTGEGDNPFSRELCGGTHARNTSELGFFKIIQESSVGSHARRIEALTSAGALMYVDERLQLLNNAAAALKCPAAEITHRVEQLKAEKTTAEQKLQEALVGGTSNSVSELVASAVDVSGYKVVVASVEGLDAGALRQVWDSVRDALGAAAAVVLASSHEGKVALLAAATAPAVDAGFNAGNIIKEIAPLVGGRGGGKPTMAQAGGADVSGIEAALSAAKVTLGL